MDLVLEAFGGDRLYSKCWLRVRCADMSFVSKFLFPCQFLLSSDVKELLLFWFNESHGGVGHD